MLKYQKLKKTTEQPNRNNLQILYNDLLTIRKKNMFNKFEEQCKEIIELIIEYIMYDDKHNIDIFE
jgi:hypothetical protein